MIWPKRDFLNNQYNHLIMNLLNLFPHQTCSIYYLFNLCLGIVSYNKYWGLFSQCTAWSFSNSNKNFHSCMISICQSNSSQTKKNNLENYIAPLPWLIIMDLPNCFSVFFCRNTVELCIQYGGLKNILFASLCASPWNIQPY